MLRSKNGKASESLVEEARGKVVDENREVAEDHILQSPVSHSKAELIL